MLLKKHKYTTVSLKDAKKNELEFIIRLYLLLFMCFLHSCDEFVDVDLPKNQILGESAFEDVNTATATLRYIYDQMRDDGLESRLSDRMGIYADELDNIGSDPIYEHTVTAANGTVLGWWSDTYNLIYAANASIEGIENSTSLDLEDRNQLKGEALFIRGYLHLILTELFGPIPYITTTDYVANTSVFRMSIDEVYSHIIADLTIASALLGDDISGERVRPYRSVVEALLARTYLYTQQWELSETMASRLINSFILEPDLNKVFLKNASGSIWQYKPRVEGQNTDDGDRFIFIEEPVSFALSNSVLEAFELGDLRLLNWVGSTGEGFYAYKYKEDKLTFSDPEQENPSSLEYSIVFRLAEQYLIRAEARAQLGNIDGARSDLNVIRTRAGLPNTIATTTSELLEAILHERQVELFTERGHRWFDLKRTGKAAEILAPIKASWSDTDILFPIPEEEILLNPNLLPQNDGY